MFCGMIGAADHRCHKHTYHHRVGACVVHLGARRHGADHIPSGERLNLVIWNHGLAWRESDGAMAHQMAYEKEGGPRTRGACPIRTIATTAPSSPTLRASSTSSIGAGAHAAGRRIRRFRRTRLYWNVYSTLATVPSRVVK